MFGRFVFSFVLVVSLASTARADSPESSKSEKGEAAKKPTNVHCVDRGDRVRDCYIDKAPDQEQWRGNIRLRTKVGDSVQLRFPEPIEDFIPTDPSEIAMPAPETGDTYVVVTRLQRNLSATTWVGVITKNYKVTFSFDAPISRDEEADRQVWVLPHDQRTKDLEYERRLKRVRADLDRKHARTLAEQIEERLLADLTKRFDAGRIDSKPNRHNHIIFTPKKWLRQGDKELVSFSVQNDHGDAFTISKIVLLLEKSDSQTEVESKHRCTRVRVTGGKTAHCVVLSRHDRRLRSDERFRVKVLTTHGKRSVTSRSIRLR